ncbi:MAG: hypothetical protein K2N17_00385 [Clostridia bacterium]|nr:hypothetical protein [Clostridia bacterium]
MKKFVSAIIAVATLVLCFTLCACATKYVSHYSATTMKTTNTSDKASISFSSFSGTYVMKFDEKVSGEVCITYQAMLAEGNIKVYYDFNEEKLDLFEIGSNGNVNGKTEAFTGNKTIYVIIESDGNCSEGSFSVALEKSQK